MGNLNSMSNDKKEKTFPETSLFFLKKVKEELKKKCWNYNGVESEYVVIVTREYDYIFNVIKLIEKIYTKKGWTCKLTHFYRGTKEFKSFTFQFKKQFVKR